MRGNQGSFNTPLILKPRKSTQSHGQEAQQLGLGPGQPAFISHMLPEPHFQAPNYWLPPASPHFLVLPITDCLQDRTGRLNPHTLKSSAALVSLEWVQAP